MCVCVCVLFCPAFLIVLSGRVGLGNLAAIAGSRSAGNSAEHIVRNLTNVVVLLSRFVFSY